MNYFVIFTEKISRKVMIERTIREPYGTIHGKYEVLKCTKIPVFGSLKPVIKETWSFNNLMTRTDEIIKIWMPVKIS